MFRNRDYIDPETGEFVENATILTSDDIKRYKKYKEAKEQYTMREEYMKGVKKENGTFIWLLYNVNTVLDFGVSTATLARLIFLSTYIENDNKLWLNRSKGESMGEEDIKQLLNLSDRSFFRFMQEVTEKKILIKDNCDCYYINNAFFAKGKLSKIMISNQLDKRYMKIYNKTVRALYKSSRVAEHYKLAYLFQMIPFVNIEFNILCNNPLEIDKKKIEAMTMEEYCKLIGYDPNNARRLKSQLKRITINKIPVLNFVDNLYGLFCFVNPRVFYGGKPDNLKEIEILGEFKKSKHKK